MVKFISFPVLVGILCVGSLTANATATGTMYLAQEGRIGEISEPAPILIGETAIFLVTALIILLKLIDFVVRERYRYHNGAEKDVKSTETSKDGAKKSNGRNEDSPTGE